MNDVAIAIAPIFLLIGLGSLLRWRAGFNDGFWRLIEKLTFNGLFPSLLFVKIAESAVDWNTGLKIAPTIVIGILVTAVATIPLRRLLGLEMPAFVAMFQGGFRSNAYVGIAVVLGVLGDTAAGPLAICMLVVGITINFLGVCAHLYWLPSANASSGLRGVIRDTIRNPLILACVAGGVFNAADWGLPPIVGPSLVLVSQAALPMGLLAVGAGLNFGVGYKRMIPVIASCSQKLILQPAITYACGVSLGLSGMALLVPVIFAALPTSSTSYVVSRRMGSDADLMAMIVTVSHLASMITLPVLLLMI